MVRKAGFIVGIMGDRYNNREVDANELQRFQLKLIELKDINSKLIADNTSLEFSNKKYRETYAQHSELIDHLININNETEKQLTDLKKKVDSFKNYLLCLTDLQWMNDIRGKFDDMFDVKKKVK